MERRCIAWLIGVVLCIAAWPSGARFLSVDPVPSAGARHAYADGNPMTRTDPDGRQSIAWVASHGQLSPDGRHAALAQALGDGQRDGARLLVAAFLAQFADGPGGLAASPANLLRGIRAEARILAALGQAKNTTPIDTRHGRTIPDFENATHVGEIKDARRVAMTPQLRAQLEHAQRTGRTHVVVTGTHTHVTATVLDASTVIRRDDLGPQP